MIRLPRAWPSATVAAAILPHARVETEAISRGDSEFHAFVENYLREESARKVAATELNPSAATQQGKWKADPGWGDILPFCMRRQRNQQAEAASYSDVDRIEYLCAAIAIDFRHWVPKVRDSAMGENKLYDAGQFYYAETMLSSPREEEDVRPKPPTHRGSYAMMMMLRECVDVDGLFWHRVEHRRHREAASAKESVACPLFDGADEAAVQSCREVFRRRLTGFELDDPSKPVPMPAFDERLEVLKELYDGFNAMTDENGSSSSSPSFARMLVQSKHRLTTEDRTGFLDRLLALAPRYRDSYRIAGLEGGDNEMYVLKLAQLTVVALQSLAAAGQLDEPEKYCYFEDLDKLTVASDYQLPKGLRVCGLLSYSPELSMKVDEGALIKAGSDEEMALRVGTVLAADCLLDYFNAKLKAEGKDGDELMTVSQMDFCLWKYGRTKAPSGGKIRHHLTFTRMY